VKKKNQGGGLLENGPGKGVPGGAGILRKDTVGKGGESFKKVGVVKTQFFGGGWRKKVGRGGDLKVVGLSEQKQEESKEREREKQSPL